MHLALKNRPFKGFSFSDLEMPGDFTYLHMVWVISPFVYFCEYLTVVQVNFTLLHRQILLVPLQLHIVPRLSFGKHLTALALLPKTVSKCPN